MGDMCLNRYYCKKCGALLVIMPWQEKECMYCGSEPFPLPKEYDKYTFDKYDKVKADVMEKYVKTSPEFNPRSAQYREKRQAASRARQAAMDAAKAAGEDFTSSRVPKVECPYCHSTNTQRISILSKAADTYIFGIFSMSRNSKNFHCNKCGADF